MATNPATVLWGRERERAALDRVVSDAVSGRSSVLVIRGEPGIGKTALLDDLCDRANGVSTIRAAGVESEAELAFAVVQNLCSQGGPGIDRLPEPQRDAVRVAFGLSSGPRPDPFLVGLGVLNRLADLAEQQPLLCVVDDAQWLDGASAQTLAFVARRLEAEAVALVFAVREPVEQLTGLPELVLSGLQPDDARRLLASALSVPLDEPVRDRFIAETRGNPLALLELPRGLSASQLAGGFALIGTEGVSGRVEDSFQRRVEELPAETRLLLLIAAAEPVGDPVLLWRAAGLLGVPPDASVAAEEAGLLSVGVRVVFRHPLVRSATYRSGSVEERRQVHRALAEATDAEVDPDRRAWHRALAAAGLDEEVAQELERSADRAQARGGLAAAAAFLELAVALTPDPARRGPRALEAAQAKLAAGAPGQALELLSIARASPLGGLDLAQSDTLRARIGFAVHRGTDAAPLLLAAAKRLELLDVRLARDTYLEAFAATLFAGRFAGVRRMLEAAEAAQAAPRLHPPRATDLLVDAVAVLFTEGYVAAAPMLLRAVNAFRSEGLSTEEGLRSLPYVSQIAPVLWDYDGWHALADRQLEMARNVGALSVLPTALSIYAAVHLFGGEFDLAAELFDDATVVADAIGALPGYASLALVAWQARGPEAIALINDSARLATERREGGALTFIQWAMAVLYNGLSRYEEALDAAQQADEHPEELYDSWILPELVEAAARSGRGTPAAAALQKLSEVAQAIGTDWALGIEARSRALLSDNETAEGLYREAVDRLMRTGVRIELARARLVYGEWLRRVGRRVDAREQLRAAHQMFESFGAGAFVARAARELAATGERVRKSTRGAADELTPQEMQIARLAAEGHSNREIGARLFISHSTVGYHLHKVFTKLGVGNRAQLHGVLDGAASSSKTT
jgi:DNA-binding CsgD family transcriptional regulator